MATYNYYFSNRRKTSERGVPTRFYETRKITEAKRRLKEAEDDLKKAKKVKTGVGASLKYRSLLKKYISSLKAGIKIEQERKKAGLSYRSYPKFKPDSKKRRS